MPVALTARQLEALRLLVTRARVGVRERAAYGIPYNVSSVLVQRGYAERYQHNGYARVRITRDGRRAYHKESA